MTAIEFLEDVIKLQLNYLNHKVAGYYNPRIESKILFPVMDKYGMSHEEALLCAQNKLTFQEYIRILKEKEGK